jgi:hypothetical protein
MTMRNRRWKSARPASLSEAMDLCLEHATAVHRRTAKVLADLMGVEIKTFYRWMADTSMPLNRVRQFETFCGCCFISEYLCLAHGDKVVIDIPLGKKVGVADLADVQCNFGQAIALLSRFYDKGEALDETIAAVTTTLTQLAYQRGNVLKAGAPELELFGAEQ